MQDQQGRRAVAVSVGNGGWVCYRASDLAEPMFARLAESPDGRLDVTELYLSFANPRGARDFRELSEHLSRLHTMANGELAEGIRAKLNLPGPDLRTAASYYVTRVKREPPRGWTWPERMLLAQGDDTDEPKPAPRRLPPLPEPDDVDLALDVPTTRPHPDGFYADVARVYEDAARESARPAAWVAEFNDVPVKTVQRWVAEARRRGHLPPARPGRYG